MKNTFTQKNFFQSIKFAFMLFSLILVSCGDASSQTTQLVSNNTFPKTQLDYVNMLENLKKENLRQYLLAAMNLCQNEDYQKLVGDKRESAMEFEGNTWCLNYIQWPFINPYEYYMQVVEGVEKDQSIILNQGNSFKLKEIREGYSSDVERIKEASLEININELKQYNISWMFGEYDFDKGKLQLYNTHYGFSTGCYVSNQKEVKEALGSLTCEEKDAKKLFDFYEKLKADKSIGYRRFKELNSIITYSLSVPESSKNKSKGLEITIKKIELFNPKSWSEKIGEFVF